MTREYIYLGHDNIFSLILYLNNEPADLSGVTKMTITIGDITIASNNSDTDPIRWGKTGYSTGEVRFFLGTQNLSPGEYEAPLVVYDSAYVNGIVWSYVPLTVVAEVEKE
ncbi:MAG: hypothetical protein ABIL39_11525 [candidate division WOR-3 bacterium]